jgi:hypothetical protein
MKKNIRLFRLWFQKVLTNPDGHDLLVWILATVGACALLVMLILLIVKF